MVDFQAALCQYREAAAARFAAFIPPLPPTSLSPAPYKRSLFPALTTYLEEAAQRYANFKATPLPKRRRPIPLGNDGPLRLDLHAGKRRENWLQARATARHVIAAIKHKQTAIQAVLYCGIPIDVRERYRRQYLQKCASALRRAIGVRMPILHERGVKLGREGETVGWIHKDTQGYAQHLARCIQVQEKGGRILSRIAEDSFDDVRRRYIGKPDELYRRKMARRYARWRREHMEQICRGREREVLAEREMKRRRGYDQTLSNRRSDDSSLMPFLFDTSGTYAFSSKISEAPRLRRQMVDKYSRVQGSRGVVHAEQVTKEKPLFHTRVMNRFS